MKLELAILLEWTYRSILYHCATAPSGPQNTYCQTFMITLRHTTLGSGRVLRPTQRPLPDNTQHSQDTHPRPQQDSNAQSQQASGRRPTP